MKTNVFRFIRDSGLWAPLLATLCVIAAYVTGRAEIVNTTLAQFLMWATYIGLIAAMVYAWCFSPDARRVREYKNRV